MCSGHKRQLRALHVALCSSQKMTQMKRDAVKYSKIPSPGQKRSHSIRMQSLTNLTLPFLKSDILPSLKKLTFVPLNKCFVEYRLQVYTQRGL